MWRRVCVEGVCGGCVWRVSVEEGVYVCVCMCVVTGIMAHTFKHMKDTLQTHFMKTHTHTYYVSLVPRPTSQLRMDSITAMRVP